MGRYTCLFLLVFAIALLGCKKAENRSCAKTEGEEVRIERELEDFNSIIIGTRLKVNLIQDSINKVSIIGGENLVNFVESEVDGLELTLANNNKCTYLRPKSKIPEVNVHFIDIKELIISGSDTVKSLKPIETHELKVLLEEGASVSELEVDVHSLNVFYRASWNLVYVRGKANKARFDLRGDGQIHSESLNVPGRLSIVSRGSGPIYCLAPGTELKVEILGYGNVYYTGETNAIDFTDHNRGKLIKQ